MMKPLIAAGALLTLTALSGTAFAETVVRESGPDVSVEHREDVVVEKRVTTPPDCGSKTVHKEDSAGNSTTVHKEGCD